jgi:hypothetical protein
MKITKKLRIFYRASAFTILLGVTKYSLHILNWEPIEQTSLHNSLVSGAIFVMGFVLSATITDYKESERIPAEFASTIENMYEDAREIHRRFPDFDLNAFRCDLIDILGLFREGTRRKRRSTRREISKLNHIFGQMDAAGVQPNYIVRLKQQQAQLLRCVYRVNYIQKITFIPSASILVNTMAISVIGVLLFTNVDPYYGGLAITVVITFLVSYIVQVVHVISTPFHEKGVTYDDVSLFLLHETRKYLSKNT